MTEYIIDDGVLATWRSGCINWGDKNPHTQCHGCKFDNKKRGGCDFDDDEMQKIFQSKPLIKNSFKVSSALDQALNEGDGVYMP
ncbi:MAG: hypothetical protein WC998_07960 [Candidatus Paceibacterota bacterium]|jgi:hypothetical protein